MLNEPSTEKECQPLRGSRRKCPVCCDIRPNLSAKLSLIQAKINQAYVKDLLEANRLLHEAKVHRCASQVNFGKPLKGV